MTKSGILRWGLYGFFAGVAAGDLLRGAGEWYLMPAGAVISAAGILFFRRDLMPVVFAVIIFFLFGVARISLEVLGFGTNDVAFYVDMPQKITVEGAVSAQPEYRNNAQYILLAAKRIFYNAGGHGTGLQGTGVHDAGGKVLIKADTYPPFNYADEIKASGRLQSPADMEGFSYKEYLAKDNVYAVMYNPVIELRAGGDAGGGAEDGDDRSLAGGDFFGAIYALKSLITERTETYLNEPAAGIALGLLIGARSSIPRAILDDFQKTGLTHILAISGYNITLIINVFALLMGGAGRRPRFWVTCAMIGVFAVLTGLSASVVRASVMGVLAILAGYLGRKGAGLQMLMCSAFLMVAANPLILLRDISFQLSFLSTMGLLVLLPLIENLFKSLPPLIAESLSVTLAATVFTTPVILMNFERFSIISPFANVIFLPLIPMIMFASFLLFVGSLVFAPAAYFFGAISWFLIELLVSGVRLTAAIPFAMIELSGFGAVMMIVWYGTIYAMIRFFRKSRWGQGGFSRPVQF